MAYKAALFSSSLPHTTHTITCHFVQAFPDSQPPNTMPSTLERLHYLQDRALSVAVDQVFLRNHRNPFAERELTPEERAIIVRDAKEIYRALFEYDSDEKDDAEEVVEEEETYIVTVRRHRNTRRD
jgi:hypothetical protein